MSNLQKYGDVQNWATIFASGDVNTGSITNGYGIVSSVTIDNSSSLDLYMDISFQCSGTMSPSGTPHLDFYLLPLLADGSTYADGDSGTTTAANQPTISCWAGSLYLRTKASSAQNGMIPQVRLPPGKALAYLINNSGVTLPSTGITISGRIYSETNNG